MYAQEGGQSKETWREAITKKTRRQDKKKPRKGDKHKKPQEDAVIRERKKGGEPSPAGAR